MTVDKQIGIYSHKSITENYYEPVLKEQSQEIFSLNNKAARKFNILAKVTHASICQSDRRALLGIKSSFFAKKDLILGHEGGGYIIDSGPWSESLPRGQKVVFLPHLTCLECEPCQRGDTNLCTNLLHMGFHFHGSLSNFILLPYQCIRAVTNDFPGEALPLIEPLSCVLHALAKLENELQNLNDASRTATNHSATPFTIYGSGPMGCLIAMVIRRRWPFIRIRMIDVSPIRLEIAQAATNADEIFQVHSHLTNKQCYTSHKLSIIATNSHIAQLMSIRHTGSEGSIVLFVGANIHENCYAQCEITPQAIERIHRQEKREYFAANNCFLIGTSGYNQHDVTCAINELERYYDNIYKKVQNVRINGLNNPILLNLLAPKGTEDNEYGAMIQQTLKVLISI